MEKEISTSPLNMLIIQHNASGILNFGAHKNYGKFVIPNDYYGLMSKFFKTASNDRNILKEIDMSSKDATRLSAAFKDMERCVGDPSQVYMNKDAYESMKNNEGTILGLMTPEIKESGRRVLAFKENYIIEAGYDPKDNSVSDYHISFFDTNVTQKNLESMSQQEWNNHLIGYAAYSEGTGEETGWYIDQDGKKQNFTPSKGLPVFLGPDAYRSKLQRAAHLSLSDLSKPDTIGENTTADKDKTTESIDVLKSLSSVEYSKETANKENVNNGLRSNIGY